MAVGGYPRKKARIVSRLSTDKPRPGHWIRRQALEQPLPVARAHLPPSSSHALRRRPPTTASTRRSNATVTVRLGQHAVPGAGATGGGRSEGLVASVGPGAGDDQLRGRAELRERRAAAAGKSRQTMKRSSFGSTHAGERRPTGDARPEAPRRQRHRRHGERDLLGTVARRLWCYLFAPAVSLREAGCNSRRTRRLSACRRRRHPGRGSLRAACRRCPSPAWSKDSSFPLRRVSCLRCRPRLRQHPLRPNRRRHLPCRQDLHRSLRRHSPQMSSSCHPFLLTWRLTPSSCCSIRLFRPSCSRRRFR